LTYSREVTNKIVECWGLGFTAEETVTVIENWKGITIALNTVYRHRHSLTAQQIIDELIRKQMRDIAKEEDGDLRMKYRDKLLAKFIPQRIESISHQIIDQNVKIDATDDEDTILSKAAAILTRKRESQSIH